MFSIRHEKIREKKFLLPEERKSVRGSRHHDCATMTDNHLLFIAQRARVEASTKPTLRGRLRRLFGLR